MARPSSFTQEVADNICARLAEGESLRAICRDDAMPSQTTIFRWLADKLNKAFREQYAHAREVQAESMFEEMLEIADDGRNDTYQTDDGERTNQDVIARSRLRVDARKWALSKMLPKKYGDKVSLTGEGGGPIQTATEVTFKIVRPDANPAD